MNSKLLIIIMLTLSNFAMASECEEKFTKAGSEDKTALGYEVESNKTFLEMQELAKDETRADLLCKNGKLNFEENTKAIEHYKLASKYFLAASKSCPKKFALMAKEKVELTNEQIKMRNEHLKKMNKFVSLHCK